MRTTTTTAILTATCIFIAAPASADLLWDNGPMVTHPGGHPTGADSSKSQPGSAMGGNVGLFGTGNYFRRADDFAVSAPGGWSVDSVRIYLYSNSGEDGLPTDPTGINVWEHMNMNIWNGMPGSGNETLIATSTSATLDAPVWTGIYRVSTGTPEATDKPVFAIDVDFGGQQIPPGNDYWIDYQVKSNSLDGHSAWTLVVMDVDEGGNPVSKPGNSRQMPIPVFGTEWETWVQAPFGHTFELAFQIRGQIIGDEPIVGDLNGDGVVDGADLGILLSAWGECPSTGACPADLNGDGVVDGADLGILLAAWDYTP